MPARVGRIVKVFEDGTAQAVNDTTNEEWYGRLIVMSGGMICFDLVDERYVPMNNTEIHPEKGEASDESRITRKQTGTPVKLGGRKPEGTAA